MVRRLFHVLWAIMFLYLAVIALILFFGWQDYSGQDLVVVALFAVPPLAILYAITYIIAPFQKKPE